MRDRARGPGGKTGLGRRHGLRADRSLGVPDDAERRFHRSADDHACAAMPRQRVAGDERRRLGGGGRPREARDERVEACASPNSTPAELRARPIESRGKGSLWTRACAGSRSMPAAGAAVRDRHGAIGGRDTNDELAPFSSSRRTR